MLPLPIRRAVVHTAEGRPNVFRLLLIKPIDHGLGAFDEGISRIADNMTWVISATKRFISGTNKILAQYPAL